MMVMMTVMALWGVAATAAAAWYRSESEHYQQQAQQWYTKVEMAKRHAERLRDQRDRVAALLQEARDGRLD